MHVFFGIPWHLKVNQTLEQLKIDLCYHGIRVRFSVSRLWWYHLFRDDRTISIKA